MHDDANSKMTIKRLSFKVLIEFQALFHMASLSSHYYHENYHNVFKDEETEAWELPEFSQGQDDKWYNQHEHSDLPS